MVSTPHYFLVALETRTIMNTADNGGGVRMGGDVVTVRYCFSYYTWKQTETSINMFLQCSMSPVDLWWYYPPGTLSSLACHYCLQPLFRSGTNWYHLEEIAVRYHRHIVLYIANGTERVERFWSNNPLQWHHNDLDCVSNHQPYDCLLNQFIQCADQR